MSKNVAVFVDVANIFYAAKAAGIDIDYVTLLKAATAGRDFVRAYAYTGLDPENENQKQFHAFLARSGYKVISKDIRKYGDGRIKANLDIELVVDMLKTARNLDIAVVVSGDGDFASAIRAVQEMGVRVEVISFRGNTSSDLIDVADVFMDIAQVARVDKTSGRSGRRVAADGDLSMTEVPEKETEGAPRRRRTQRREERQATPESDANLVVLPGEHLSRAAGEGDADQDEQTATVPAAAEDGGEAGAEDGRRRRRRRGGRGRGRGRRADGELATAGVPGEAEGDEDEEDAEFDELPPTQPAHQTFGSVWDTQLGMASPATPQAVELGDVEADAEDLEEPEVPEYLLAERRQHGQRTGRGRTGRGRSAYQQALDRERYGRGTAQPSFGSGRPQAGGRERTRGGRPQGRGRPSERAPRFEERPQQPERSQASEPWSEVPPELEEMLRAELARKAPSAATEPETARHAEPVAAIEPAAKPAARRRTTRAKKSEPEGAAAAQASVEATEATAAASADEAPAKPATRRRTTRAKKSEPEATAVLETAAAAAEEEPKKTVRRRRTTSAAKEG